LQRTVRCAARRWTGALSCRPSFLLQMAH